MRNRKAGQAQQKMTWLSTFILVGVFILLVYCVYVALCAERRVDTVAGELPGDVDLLHPITNPEVAGQIIEYNGFTVDFNPNLHIPNWVSWELTAAETSGSHDWDKFMADDNVSATAYPSDYTGSGYDRGHMVPRADMRWSREGVHDCYYMTNMCPQTHSLNAGTWKKLETKCREWAEIDSLLVIICGPVLTPVPDEFIGKTQVAVPKAFFKVVAAPRANPPRAIGFIMNNGHVEGGMQAAAVTVDSVEAITGHDFFAELPDSIERDIENQCRFHYWSARKAGQ